MLGTSDATELINLALADGVKWCKSGDSHISFADEWVCRGSIFLEVFETPIFCSISQRKMTSYSDTVHRSFLIYIIWRFRKKCKQHISTSKRIVFQRYLGPVATRMAWIALTWSKVFILVGCPLCNWNRGRSCIIEASGDVTCPVV